MVIKTYVKECRDGDCHCLFVTSSGYKDLCQGVWGWRLSLFVCDLYGHRDLCQGVWGWRLSLFVCDL